MKQQVVPPGGGKAYDWSKDHVCIKTSVELTEGRVTVVEDTLKPGFELARHYHMRMTEIFYILEGEVAFSFDDEAAPVLATKGATINIPPHVWHRVSAPTGCKLLTIFTPGGFDKYLEEIAPLSAEQFADQAYMMALNERYDSWTR